MSMFCALMLYGGLGAQLNYDYADPNRNNDYGWEIGEAGLQCSKEGFILEAYHLSGVNQSEPDNGVNALFVCYELNVTKYISLTIESGYNFSEGTTNTFGRRLYKADIEYRFSNGMYFKAVKLNNAHYLSTGFTAYF